jgi:hypothetical protein
MTKSKHFHIIQLAVLGGILLTGIAAFYQSVGIPNRQFLIVLVTAFLYVCWGILHHAVKGDLHPRIMVEYILIAAIVIVLLRGAIYG